MTDDLDTRKADYDRGDRDASRRCAQFLRDEIAELKLRMPRSKQRDSIVAYVEWLIKEIDTWAQETQE